MTSLVRSLTTFTQREIRTLFRIARPVVVTPDLEVRTSPATLDYGRILIVIPRRVGNAPQRNQLRRRIKALFYEQRWFEQRIDAIVLTKPESITLSFEQLRLLLAPAFKA